MEGGGLARGAPLRQHALQGGGKAVLAGSQHFSSLGVISKRLLAALMDSDFALLEPAEAAEAALAAQRPVVVSTRVSPLCCEAGGSAAAAPPPTAARRLPPPAPNRSSWAGWGPSVTAHWPSMLSCWRRTATAASEACNRPPLRFRRSPACGGAGRVVCWRSWSSSGSGRSAGWSCTPLATVNCPVGSGLQLRPPACAINTQRCPLSRGRRPPMLAGGAFVVEQLLQLAEEDPK